MSDNGVKRDKTAKRGPGKPFEKGNKLGGRPQLPAELKAACQSKSIEAIRVLGELMSDSEQPGSVRVRAAEALLDRGYGKPVQPIDSNPYESMTQDELIRAAGTVANEISATLRAISTDTGGDAESGTG